MIKSSIKRSAALLLLAAITVACAGCFSPAYSEKAPAVPESTPQPQGMEKLFGKEITVALWSDDEAFTLGANTQADSLGMTLTPVESAERAALHDIVLVCSEDYDPEALDIPAVLFAAEPEEAPEGFCKILYDKAGETEFALSALYGYASHEAPIRMLALYDPESDGAAASACNLMAQQGKLHIKGESSSTNAKAAAADMLDNVTVGLLDTVFTENAGLAMQAYEALKEAQRGDAVEVITCGLNEDIIQAMIEEHFLMGAASGPDMWGAGALALRMGLTLLAGEPVENVSMQPFTLYSDDVIAAYREGVTDIGAIMQNGDSALASLYQNEVVDYMRRYYGN